MNVGVSIPTFASDSHVVPPGSLKDLCRRIDRMPFTGIWLNEHIINPPSYQTSFLNPLTTLATVAGVTENVSVGTSIMMLPMRHPLHVAKRAATVQHLAEQPLTLGLGVGYVEAEYDAVGVPFEERGPRFAESIQILRALFSGEEVTFDGNFYSLDGVQLEPRPRRPPRILRGGATIKSDDGRRLPRSFKESLDSLDGWLALPKQPDDLTDEWEIISSELEGRGERSSSFDRTLFTYIHVVPTEDSDEAKKRQREQFRRLFADEARVDWAFSRSLTGSKSEIREKLLEVQELGFDEVILGPIVSTAPEYRRQLDLIESICPYFE